MLKCILSELHAKMEEFSDGSEVYSIKRLKQKLQEQYRIPYSLLKWVVVTMLFASKTWQHILLMRSGTQIEKTILKRRQNLFGLGVELDHVFGSKWLVNELARLGFSVSYDEAAHICY